jgi:Big-like domain-containing protein
MSNRTAKLLLNTVALALLTTCFSAEAVLLDHGPQDPTLVLPTWYRDFNGLALSMCLSTTPSPNPGAGLKPMCFPLNPDPAGFPGNVGPEIFYNNLTTTVQKGNPNFSMKYLAALEASYLPVGFPAHGTESVFARIRITINTPTPGVYKVTHPYGVEVFNVGPFDVGPRAVFFTADVPVGVPLNFEAALQGRVGPFLQWDFVDPGFTLSVKNAAGATETFVADPNLNHTYTGSPFGTNFVRVDGPPGSNISGIGDDFIQNPLGAVVGQQLLAAIPTPMTIKRATYSVDPVKGVTGVDVYAASTPGQTMILTATGLPSVTMQSDAAGNYFSHVEIPATAIIPAAVQVTNATSNPVVTVTQGVTDAVEVTSSTFDTLTRVLKVTAASSDKSAVPPALSVSGPLGGLMTTGAYSTILAPGILPPATVTVVSGAGGIDADEVAILPGLTDARPNPPVAVPDAIVTNENVAASVDLTVNDAITPPALVSRVVVVTPPTNGTASPIGINTGVVTYTPNANFFGADTFQYVVVDTTGAVSNVATVTVTVNFVPVAPTANPDDFAMLANKALPLASRTINVLANDTVAAGTAINPASVIISTRPLHGNVTVDLAGNVTYTPVLNYSGADSFQYTVANTAGVASAPATVSVVVEGGPEAVSIAKATFATAKTQWTIVGATNWFGPTLLHTTVTCWIGKGVAVGALIGTGPVDQFGKFQLVPPPLTTPAPDATNLFTCQTSNGGVVSAVVSRI